jgi:hypothetical protein
LPCICINITLNCAKKRRRRQRNPFSGLRHRTGDTRLFFATAKYPGAVYVLESPIAQVTLENLRQTWSMVKGRVSIYM